MKVHFYHIHKGTRVGIVKDEKLLHTFVGETDEPSEVTFNIPRHVVTLRARHPRGHTTLEILDYAERKGITVSCQGVYEQRESLS